MKKALLVGGFWLALCGSGEASTVIAPESGTSFPYQRWIDRAGVATASTAVTVLEAPCPRHAEGYVYSGCSSAIDGRIWLNASLGYPQAVRAIFYHELGHQFDRVALDDTERGQFMTAFDLGGNWVQDDLADLSQSPNERFAALYQQCAKGRFTDGRWHRFKLEQPMMRVRVLRWWCGWISRASV